MKMPRCGKYDIPAKVGSTSTTALGPVIILSSTVKLPIWRILATDSEATTWIGMGLWRHMLWNCVVTTVRPVRGVGKETMVTANLRTLGTRGNF